MKQRPTKRIACHSLVLITAIMICNLSSCANSSHLLLYQQSNLGLNTGMNPSTQNLHVRVGLRREFGAIIPKYSKDEGGFETQAASAYFGSRARITSPWRVPEVSEVMATGPAAVIAAKSGKSLDLTSNP
jgi:hypothetical protein